MHSPTLLIFLALLFASAAGMGGPPPGRRLSARAFEKKLMDNLPSNKLLRRGPRARNSVMRAKQFVERNGCDARVCFALDIGVFVTQEEYEMQKDFATIVAAVAGSDPRMHVAVAQYGLTRNRLQWLSPDVDRFLTLVDQSTTPGAWTPERRRMCPPCWRRKSRQSFRRTLKFCRNQLLRGRGPSAKKMVIIGDLRSPRNGAHIARQILPPQNNGAICAVGFGKGNKARLERFTTNPQSVLAPDQTSEVIDLIEEVVKNICGPTEMQKANSVFTETV